jgi:hypothetical protein
MACDNPLSMIVENPTPVTRAEARVLDSRRVPDSGAPGSAFGRFVAIVPVVRG